MMKTSYTLFFICFLLISGNKAFSQMVGDNIFLQGAYVEIGIAPNGGFGSTRNAPTGYHPNNPGDFFYDPALGTSVTADSNLGFVADYGADGWAVGSPPFFGDFYLPGTPQEGWAIEIQNVESHAYIPAYYATGTTGFTGGLSGTNTSYTNSGGVIQGIWQGKDVVSGGGVLTIKQVTTLDTARLYFTVTVYMLNTGSTTLSNIYYMRTVDPDNDQTHSGSYVTDNSITYQLPSVGNKVLVSTTGTVYTAAYLGLGTKDTRAKCMIFTDGLTSSYSIDSLYNYPVATGYIYGLGATSVQDVGIGLDYKIGSLAPGQCTSLTYAYVLNSAYIDTALNATVPEYVIDGVLFNGPDTINTCQYPYDSVAINIANGGSYTWSWAPDSFIQITTGVHNVIHVDSVNNFLTYTVTGANAIGGCDTIHYYLTVEHAPYTLASPHITVYCQGATADSLTVPSTVPDTLKWYTTPTGGVASPTAPIPSTVFAGTTVYYVSESHGYCNSYRAPDTVTVVPAATAPYVYDPSPYCQGQAFVPFTTVGTNILWYTSPSGGTGSPTAPTINTNIPGTYINYVTQTIPYTVSDTSISCTSPITPVSVIVSDSILPAFIPHLSYGCTADTFSFSNSTTGARHYAWSFGDGASDTTGNPTHVYLTQGTFTVILTATNGSCVKADTQTVTINHVLKAGFTYDNGIICQHSTVNFTDTSTGLGLSYKWFFGNGATDMSKNPSNTYNNAGVYKVKLVVADFVPCYDTAYANISVDSSSNVIFGLSDTVICQGTYINFSGIYTSIGFAGITWYPGNGDSIKNVNPLSYAYDVPGTYYPSVNVYFRACPNKSQSRSIVVVQQPVINLGPDTSICAGSGPITLADNINAENPSAHWLWSTGQTTPAITIGAPGNYAATVNINSCYATDSVLVLNSCYMDIPNVFTPNHDGVNDNFYPRDLLTRGLITFKMDIYNRWGQLIFETTSLDGAGWDGKLNNTDQPEGVYIYNINGTFKDGQREHRQGNVTLLR